MPEDIKNSALWRIIIMLIGFMSTVGSFISAQGYFLGMETRDLVREVHQRQQDIVIPHIDNESKHLP